MADDLGTLRGRIVLDIKQALGAYREMRQQHQSLIFSSRQVGDAFTQSGHSMVRGGIAIVGAFAASVSAAAEFERKMDFFAAVSNSNEKQMKELSKVTLQMAADTIYSADQVAEGFIELGKAGISAKQIIDGVGDAVLSLGAAGDIPLAQAGQIITSVVQQFDLAATDATEVANKLAGAANASIVEIDDLGVSLKYVGGVASAAGLSFEDVNTALAILGKAGIRGSTAGTSLRQMIVSLGGATKPAMAALKELGIVTEDGSNKFFTQEGKLKSLAQVYQIMQDSLDGYSQKEKLAFMRTIFNNRALSAAAILTREGAAGFAEMNKEIGKTTAADVASERLDNLSGDIEILKGNIQTFMIEAGTPFQKFLRGIVQGITKMVQAFGKLPDPVQTALLSITAVVGILLILMGIFAIIIGTIFRFVESFLLLKGSGDAVKAVFSSIWKVLLFILKPLILIAKAAWWVFKMFTPWGKVVTVVLLLVGALIWLYKNSDIAKQKIQAAGQAIADFGSKVLAAVMPAINAFLKLLPSADQVKEAFLRVGAAINTLRSMGFSGIAAAIGGAMVNLAGIILNVWVNLPGILLGLFLKIGTFLVKALLGLIPAVAGILGSLIGTILGFFITLPLKVATFMLTLVTTIMGFFLGLLPKIASTLGFLLGFLIGFFIRMVILAVVHGARFIAAVIGFFITLPGRILGYMGAMLSAIISGIIRIISWVISNAPRIAAGFIATLISLPGRIAGIIGKIPGAIRALVSSAASAAKNFATGLYDGVKGKVAEIPGLVGGIVGKATQAFKDAVSSAFNAAKGFAKGLWDGFKSGLGIASPSYIERAMWQINGVLKTEAKVMGRQVMQVQRISKQMAATQFNTGFDVSAYTELAKAQKAVISNQGQLSRALGVGQAAIQLAISNKNNATNKKLVPVDGTVRFDDKTGRVMFQGWAKEVYEGESEFQDTLSGLGGK